MCLFCDFCSQRLIMCDKNYEIWRDIKYYLLNVIIPINQLQSQ